MSIGGYKIRNKEGIHFITFAVVEWVDVFTRKEYPAVRHGRCSVNNTRHGRCFLPPAIRIKDHLPKSANAIHHRISSILQSNNYRVAKLLDLFYGGYFNVSYTLIFNIIS